MVGVAGRSKGCNTCKKRKIAVSDFGRSVSSFIDARSVAFNGLSVLNASSQTACALDISDNMSL